MMKWWLGSGQSNKHAVKVTQLKLQLGLFGAKVSTTVNDRLAIEITWVKKENHQNSSPPSCSIIPFQFHHRTLKRPCTHTTPCRRFITSAKTPSLVWDERDLCVFDLALRDVCHVAFHVLYHSEDGVEESKDRRTVVGKVSMTLNMEEMKNESNIQRKLPIRLKVNGLIFEANLSVCLRSCDSARTTFENTVKPDKKHGIIEKVKYLTCLTNKNNGINFDSFESDDSPVFDSDDSSNESTTSGGSSSSTSPKEPRITFLTSEKKPNFNTLHGSASKWGTNYILSRDCQTKLKTNVFFASFDQRSEKASGESACTVLVALIAHWLHSNHGSIPTRTQFDSLITQGSSEWRKLCKSDYYSKLFPDKHFDLETVIDANLRPVTVLPQKSYTGFFSPEKFRCLEGAMSFDEIWKEIESNKMDDFEERIYIVSWNDHFFILKVEIDAYYIIDSLGERLFEGCQRAFVLKFDESSVVYGKRDEVGGVKSSNSRGEESFEVVCRGKECCKEFIKRFLAAISVRQLEREEKKWIVSNPNLHRQLQIDFHFSMRL
ncbi:uncharacterized protein LOC131660621 [Vicia villosa]|uniref:uncharacterized protein LOC131660621 n=1 Tax=Vicia villosa TaxID=3911 RepID=UPI00273B4479|nr:uncharacterized protein LOC131660621 [Vicia villosa]